MSLGGKDDEIKLVENPHLLAYKDLAERLVVHSKNSLKSVSFKSVRSSRHTTCVVMADYEESAREFIKETGVSRAVLSLRIKTLEQTNSEQYRTILGLQSSEGKVETDLLSVRQRILQLEGSVMGLPAGRGLGFGFLAGFGGRGRGAFGGAGERIGQCGVGTLVEPCSE